MQAQTTVSIRTLADYLELTKPGITSLMLCTTLAGSWLAARGFPPLDQLFFALLGTGLATSSAAVFNNLIDRDRDAAMERTRDRPLATGRIDPPEAFWFGMSLGLGGLAVLALSVNALSAALALVGFVSYVGLYTAWLKRTTPLCTVMGGIPGAIPPVIGWAAVTNHIDAGALALFAILFFWQPPHFWALALYKRDDYRRAGFQMLLAVRGARPTKRAIVFYSGALVPISILPAVLGVVGSAYLGAAAVLGLGFVALALRLLFARGRHEERLSRSLFLYSIAYLGALVAALLITS